MSAPEDRRRPLRHRALGVVGWLFVVTGAGHASLVAAGRSSTPPAAEEAVRAAMAEATTPVGGLDRSYWDLFQGFSLLMAVLLVGFGALLLLVLRRAPQLAGGRSLPVLCGLVLVAALTISVLLLPPPPMVTLGLATVATVVALLSRPAPG